MANILERSNNQKQVYKVMTWINFSLFQKGLTPLGGKVIISSTVRNLLESTKWPHKVNSDSKTGYYE